MGELLSILVGILATVIVSIFMRAFTARMVTGHWPHETDEAKKIFEELP